MKIHYLVTSLESGGGIFVIPEIVRTLQSLGHEVSIYACEPRDMGGAVRLTEAGLSYTVLSKKRRPFSVILALYLIKTLKDRPDVIWSSFSWASRIGIRASRLLHIPTIAFKHSMSTRKGLFKVRQKPNLWVGDSKSVAGYLRNEWSIPAEKVLAWPLYKSIPDFPTAARWDGKAVLQIGSVGRLHDVKNYAGLINALSTFLTAHPQLKSRLHLTILGEGPERAALERQISSLDLNSVVSLPGFSADVGAFLSKQHVYVQTSRYEGLCLSVHEAMNAALPVIATPVGEISDAVKEDETGYILNGDLNVSLPRVLEHVFSNPESLAHYGENGRRYVLDNFSDERYRDSAAAIFDRLNTLTK